MNRLNRFIPGFSNALLCSSRLDALMYFAKLIPTLTAATLLTWGGSAIAPSRLRADMGHDHSSETSTPTADSLHEEHATPDTAMPHSGEQGDHDGPSHGMMAIPTGQPVPQVTVDIFPDPVAGWNLQVQTANWTFAPEEVNAASNPNEGHAHLYINGEKITRIYSEWYYIPSLPPGEHVLTVGLNANGHEMLMHDGEPIEASVNVIVPEPESAANPDFPGTD